MPTATFPQSKALRGLGRFAMRPEPSPSPYLSTRQVCARLGGVTRQWLWLAVRHHGFPKPLKRPGGSRCFYPLDQIEAWEATAFHANDNARDTSALNQFTVSGPCAQRAGATG